MRVAFRQGMFQKTTNVASPQVREKNVSKADLEEELCSLHDYFFFWLKQD